MPFARGTVNGITGLLRKAGSFVKACCCQYTKYSCDAAFATCYEDPGGPYGSLPECDAYCQSPRYKCNTDTYDCTEDPLGPYSDLKECRDNCKENKYYCCGSPGSPEDRDCYEQECEFYGLNPYGVYDTPKECDDNCTAPHYQCDTSTYTCKEDPSGAYTDPQECADNCKPRYKCNTDTYDCTEDPFGDYFSLQECDKNCVGPKYYCCGSPGSPEDRDCYPEPCEFYGLNPYGEYDTQEECDKECKPPKYYCCGSPGSPEDRDCYEQECEFFGLNPYGEYDTQEECDTNCKKYYCCRLSDGSVVCTQSCSGGTVVSGPYDSASQCECDGFRCDKSTYTCVQDPDGPYKTPEECERECKRKYDCVDNGDGTKSCVEVEGGKYESSDCDTQCDPRYDCVSNSEGDVECIQQEDGAYLSSDCDNECDKRYDCVDDGGGTKSCVETRGGGYTTSKCNNECEKKKYKCSPLEDGTSECIEDPGGEYEEPTCGGQCDAGFIGYCCTDYGISNGNRQQCAEVRGTFYTDYLLAFADCGCDCNIGGDYCVSDGVQCGEQNPKPPDAKCGPSPNNGWEFDYYSSGRGEQGTWSAVFCDNGDCSPLDDLRAKNAQIIGWLDYASEWNAKASEDCCLGTATATRYEYRVFALNCRKKVWEDAPNVMKGQNQFYQGSTIDDPNAFCDGGYRPGDPQRPEAKVRQGRPTCIPPLVNPLP